jgi:5-methylthioadenosine/S-adenosylhomocysteine deaminase
MKTLILNIDLVTMDADNRRYENGAILYNGDTIEYAGAFSGLADSVKVDLNNVKVIDGKGMLALPGFINAHTHIVMTAFRGFADNMPLWEWLSEKIWPMEDKLTSEDAYWLSLLGAAEMISAGITTFSDMYMFTSDIARAASDSGMRAVISRGLTEPDDQVQQRLNDIEELSKWQNGAEGRITMMIGPHAVYTCTPEFLTSCRQLAEKYGTGIHIHLAETEKEVKDCINEYGNTPVEHLYKLGFFDLPVTAAHCVHVTENDMDLMAKYHVKAVHCPSSNMKLASGFAPVDQMLNRGISVSLGTDGAASNNNLSIMKEMSLAALIAKGYTGNPKALPAHTAVEMATKKGAEAVMLSEKIGSLEAGKKADIQLINTNSPHFYPGEDPLVHLVYSGYSSDVDTVIIDGKIVLQGRELTTIDLTRVYQEVERIVKRIRS